MKSMIAVVLACCVLGACARSGDEEGVQAGSEAVSAKAAAPTVAVDPVEAAAKLALGSVAHLLGDKKPAEAYTLGEGFDIRYLDRETLRGYDGKAPMDALASVVKDRGYSVLDGGKVVASVTLHETNGAWAMSTVGVGEASGKISDLRRELRAARKADGDAFTIVQVNGMPGSFLYHREHGVELLTSWSGGAPQPAQAVLGELSERARGEAAQ